MSKSILIVDDSSTVLMSVDAMLSKLVSKSRKQKMALKQKLDSKVV